MKQFNLSEATPVSRRVSREGIAASPEARGHFALSFAAAVGAGLLATITLLPQARGELVYDDAEQGDATAEAQPTRAVTPVTLTREDTRADDRGQLRQALGASERADATLQSEDRARRPLPVARPARAYAAPQSYPAQVIQNVPPPQTVVVGAPAAAEGYVLADAAQAAPVAPAPAAEVENLSKTDLMRRERVREEIKNEDVLQERLEELRLRDEHRRTQQLLGGAPVGGAAGIAPVAPAYAPLAQDETVIAPVTERPGQAAVVPAPAVVNPAAQAKVAVVTDEVATSKAAEVSVDHEATEKTQFSLHPYFGTGNVNVSDAFEVKGHYAVGAGIGVVASDNLTFELGYTYADYGIQMAPANSATLYYQSLQAAQGNQNLETLALHQNVFDAGLKLSLLGPDSRVRPFLGGGGAYSKNYINYSTGYQNYLTQNGQASLTNDYSSSGFLGYLSTGLDVRVSKSVSLVGAFKYYTVLSSSESNNLNYMGFAQNPYAFAGDSDKRAAGASLSESSFYQVTGGASFVF